MNRLPEHLYAREEELYAPEDEANHERPAKRLGRTLAVCLLIALVGSGSAFLWRYFGAPVTGPGISTIDETSQLTIAVQGLQQSQQAIAADVKQTQDSLTAQQAAIKRMSDEIAQLAAKVDLLNSRAREAEAAAPPVHKPPPPRKPASKPVGREPASPAPLPAAEEKQ